MKRLILLVFFCTSCMEAEEPDLNTIAYEIECEHCLVYFPDNMFEKSMVVSGRLFYRFENTSLDSVYVRVNKSAQLPSLPLKVSIFQNGWERETYSGNMEEDEFVIGLKL